MFEIGWSELMLIGIVALIVIGPHELPTVLRTVGKTVAKLRRMAGEFQGQFQEALREADIADMRKEITDITDSARSTLATADMFDPLKSIREEIRSTVEGGTKTEAPRPEEPKAPDAPPAAAAAADPAPAELIPPPPAEPLPAPSFDPPAPEAAPLSAPDKSAS
ncbi:Sec-independent protein translocase protein TatB [Xanthobacter pseudotagetidis]|uniref:Sec-independent protein translocase protein TatB n=1 Tax=Xanthobacter pseudotagetidis TaxID=3119911 RepID=UPI00372CDCA6